MLTVYSCSFLFYLGVSKSHSVYFGDPSHCKPGPVHGLTVGSPSCECVDVEVIPCMTDETGWIFFFFFLFLIISRRMVENERPTTCSTPFHLHLQSISKLNGYRWSPHNCLAFLCCRVHVQIPACSQPLCHNEKAVCLYFELSRCMPCWRGGVGPW